MAKTFKLAVCSIPHEDCQRHTISAVVEAAERGADLVLLPEEPDIVGGEKAGQYTLRKHPVYTELAAQAKRHSIGVVGSLSAKVEGGIANVGFLIGRDGELIGTYRKQHPAPSEEYIVTEPEPKELCPERFPVFNFDHVSLGIAICMDIHFSEMFRIYMLKGADMVLLPTMYLDYTGDMLESIEKTRAADNQYYLGLSRYIDTPFLAGRNMGYAKIVSPDGRVIASTGHKPGVVVADFDPAWRMPFWGKGYSDMRQIYAKTRKPEVYTELLMPKAETFAGMIPVDSLRLPPSEGFRNTFLHAREEARRLGHDTLRPEALLLGMLTDGDNNGFRILKKLGTNVNEVRSHIMHILNEAPNGQPETVESLLNRAADEAEYKGLFYLDTDHLLLALAREAESVPGTALAAVGADYDAVRKAVEG